MAYRRVEPSRDIYSPPNLRCLTFMSPALKERGTVTLYLPDGHEEMESIPLVLLLHGVYGDHWSWAFMGGAHVRASELINSGKIRPMGIVMPSDGNVGEGSGYVKWPHKDCEKWIIEDVLGCVRMQYPCFSDASPLFIAGFSMGGFGALRLGSKYADLFSGISGHASVTHFDQMQIFTEDPKLDLSHLTEGDRSSLYWMKKNRESLPPLRFDCGSDDLLIEYNRQLASSLDEEEISHQFKEVPGRHSWDYCHEHLGNSLMFFHNLLE